MEFYMSSLAVAFLTGTTTNAADSLIEAITEFLTAVVGWFGTVVDALLTTDGALAPLWPLIALGICFGLVTAGINLISRFAPGL